MAFILNKNTALNNRLTLRRPVGRLRGSSRLGHFASLHSHASFHPHFTSPGLYSVKPLLGLVKRRLPKTLCASFVNLGKKKIYKFFTFTIILPKVPFSPMKNVNFLYSFRSKIKIETKFLSKLEKRKISCMSQYIEFGNFFPNKTKLTLLKK